jgi:hypothetical protein
MSLELHIVEVGLNATDADLVEQMRYMDDRRQAGFKHVGCLVRGYKEDPLPLYEIPKVVAFCKKLARIGFIAGLDDSKGGIGPFADGYSAPDSRAANRRKAELGAEACFCRSPPGGPVERSSRVYLERRGE